MSPDHQLMLAVRDGDVDVVFPRGIKADLVLTTVDGEIYTDFELDIMRNQEVKKINPPFFNRKF